jgi:hypothetical protein
MTLHALADDLAFQRRWLPTAPKPPPHSIFSGEVEALNTPTIRRLTPSGRHQLPRITPGPIASRTSVSVAFPRSSIRAAAARSKTVSKSETMTECSAITAVRIFK